MPDNETAASQDGKEKEIIFMAAKNKTIEEMDTMLKRIAAEAAANVVATASAAAIAVSTTAANAAHELATKTSLDLQYIKTDLSEIKSRLDNKFVSVETFTPIKQLVYGLVTLILVAVVGGLLDLILRVH